MLYLFPDYFQLQGEPKVSPRLFLFNKTSKYKKKTNFKLNLISHMIFSLRFENLQKKVNKITNLLLVGSDFWPTICVLEC